MEVYSVSIDRDIRKTAVGRSKLAISSGTQSDGAPWIPPGLGEILATTAVKENKVLKVCAVLPAYKEQRVIRGLALRASFNSSSLSFFFFFKENKLGV